MKRSLAFALTILFCSVTVVGCAAQEPGQPAASSDEATAPVDSPATTETPPAATEDLYSSIMSADYQADWAPAPGWESPQPAKGPHGDETQIFLDPASEKALDDGASEWPAGAVIVKDVYRDGKIVQVAAMRKDAEGWYWGEWDTEGNPVAEGLKVEPCEGCHASGTDGTLGVRLP